MGRYVALLLLTLAVAPSIARADGGERHQLEFSLGGGASLLSDAPERVDLLFGGQLNSRLMVDLAHVRTDVTATMPDPTRPDLFQLRGDARLLYVAVHDFTWRRSDAGELIRLFAGVGGDIDLPEDIGHVMLTVGFAMARLGGFENIERSMAENYGGFVGITLRLHVWEIRDELRIAVHGMLNPADIVLSLDFDVDQALALLEPGVTISNRLYIQVVREGPISAGPQLDVQIEQLFGGLAVYSTLGVGGTLGL